MTGTKAQKCEAMAKVIVPFFVLSLGLSSCANIAHETQDNSAPNSNKSQVAKQTTPAEAMRNSSGSGAGQSEARDPIAPADGSYEASSEELQKNTPLELRKLAECIVEEDVRIAPDVKGEAPLTVSFDSSASVAPCGKIVKSIWNFGDGSKARGVKVTHTYYAPGEYVVKLALTDDKGNGNLLDIEYRVVATAANTP